WYSAQLSALGASASHHTQKSIRAPLAATRMPLSPRPGDIAPRAKRLCFTPRRRIPHVRVTRKPFTTVVRLCQGLTLGARWRHVDIGALLLFEAVTNFVHRGGRRSRWLRDGVARRTGGLRNVGTRSNVGVRRYIVGAATFHAQLL